MPDEVLAHLVGLYRRLRTPSRPTLVTAGEVRRINGQMTRDPASVDGYLTEVDQAAKEAVAVSGSPVTEPAASLEQRASSQRVVMGLLLVARGS